MPKLSPQDEKQIEEQFRLVSMQARQDEENQLIKDYSFVLGFILLITGLMIYTLSIVFGGALMAMGLAAIIYRFLPW
jgi:hypothetical protein